MANNTFDGDTHVRGKLTADDIVLPNGCVGNEEADSGNPLDVDKLRHLHVPLVKQAHGTAVVARREIVHVAIGDGLVREIRAGNSVACIGNSVINVDLYKNGVTILSGAIVLDDATTAYTVIEMGSISSPDYSADNVFEIVITVSVGTGTLGQGVWVQPVFEEDEDS